MTQPSARAGATAAGMTSLTVLSAGAIRRSITKVAQLFESGSGASVSIDFAPAPKVRDRVLAGGKIDVAIASAGALDRLAAAGKIVTATRAIVGRTGMAVMVRKGGSVPDLSDATAFRRALLGADLVVYNAGSSGAYAETIIDRLGLREELGARIRVTERGGDMIDLVATSPACVLGLAQMTNALDQVEKGIAITLAGPFPDEIQNVTSYEIAVTTASANAELAGAFVRAFATPEAGKLLAAAGLG